MNPQVFAWFGMMAAPDRFARVRKLLPKNLAEDVSKEVDAAKNLSADALLARLHDLRDGELAIKRATVPGVSRMPHPLMRHLLGRMPR